MLDLPIHAWVGDCDPLHSDIIIITKILEPFPGELSGVVSDDGVRDPEIENDVLDKIYCLLGAILSQGLTSIHLVIWSTATSRCVKPPGAFLKDSKRSRPHTANDHIIGMVWSSWVGAWICVMKYWHPLQDLMI
jgi:hypothetical protein